MSCVGDGVRVVLVTADVDDIGADRCPRLKAAEVVGLFNHYQMSRRIDDYVPDRSTGDHRDFNNNRWSILTAKPRRSRQRNPNQPSVVGNPDEIHSLLN